MFKLGEVRAPTEDDHNYVRNFVESDESQWKLEYSKKGTHVWLKNAPETAATNSSSFEMLKARVDFDNVSADVVYDMVLDDGYHAEWDKYTYEGITQGIVAPCASDVGYFAVKFPRPFRNRDFVIQRSWHDWGLGKDKIIYCHSVNHAKLPPKKGLVRGLAFITATLIRPTGPKSSTLYYITHTDPGGSIPAWLVNTTTKVYAPKLMKKMQKSVIKYEKWKSKQKDPNDKPWKNARYIRQPAIDLQDITTLDMEVLQRANQSVAAEESKIGEGQVEKADANDDDD
jgi:hypothetical protein